MSWRSKAILVVCFSVSLLYINACKQPEFKQLDDHEVIDRESMVRLMADMDITEAALKTKQIRIQHDSIINIANKAFDSLYIFYKTSPRLFKKNLLYYQQDLDNYQKMIDDKIVLISKKKDSITSGIEKSVKDSTLNPINKKGIPQ